jgi:hypothetical protein
MKCLDFPLKYIGKTGRTLHTRYKEHIQAIRIKIATPDNQIIYRTQDIHMALQQQN